MLVSKPLISLSILWVFAFHAFSQDLITKRNGDEIPAKVLEVNTTDVKYRPSASTDTTAIISLAKTEIFSIKYASGFKEVFTVPANTTPTSTPKPTYAAPKPAPNTNTTQEIRYDGKRYYMGYQQLKEGDVMYKLQSSGPAEAYALMKSGVSTRRTGSVLRYFPSYPLLPYGVLFLVAGIASSNSYSGPTFAAVGGIMLGVGLGVRIGASELRKNGKQKIREALDIYNAQLVK